MANITDQKNAIEIPNDDPNHHHGGPAPSHATAAEQTREANEAHEALNNQAAHQARFVNTRPGNERAGRQGQ